LTAIFAGLGSSHPIKIENRAQFLQFEDRDSENQSKNSEAHWVLQAVDPETPRSEGIQMDIHIADLNPEDPDKYTVSEIQLQSIGNPMTYNSFLIAYDDKIRAMMTRGRCDDDKTMSNIRFKNRFGGIFQHKVTASLQIRDFGKEQAVFSLSVSSCGTSFFELQFIIHFYNPHTHQLMKDPFVKLHGVGKESFWTPLKGELQLELKPKKEAANHARETAARAAREQEARETAARAVAPPRIQRKEEWDSFFQSVTAPTNPNSTRTPTADLSFKAYMAGSHQDGYQLDITEVRKQGAKGAAESARIYTFDVRSFQFSPIGTNSAYINLFIDGHRRKKLNKMSENTTQLTIEYPIQKGGGAVEAKLVFGPKERKTNNLQEWTVTITMTFYEEEVGIEIEKMKWHDPYPKVELEKSTGSQSG